MRPAFASTITLLVWLIAPAAAPAQPASVLKTLQDEAAEVVHSYRTDLARLADWAAQRGLVAEAAAARTLYLDPSKGTLALPVISDVASTVQPPDGQTPAPPSPTSKDDPGLADARRQWTDRLTKLRRTHGEALFKIARSAAKAGLLTDAYAWIWETLAIDPDHEAARAALGYTRHDDRWLTRFEAQKLQAGQIWDNRFGWLPREHLERYEQGMRFFRGRWITEAEEKRLRKSWANAWQIDTEHYLIRTDYDLRRGLAVANELEQLHDAFARLFPAYVMDRTLLTAIAQKDIAARPDPPGVRSPSRLPLKVSYFADKQEYVATVRKYTPLELGVSTGIYLPHKQTAYFYYNEEFDRPTLLHEATHQLFSESREGRQLARTKGNFWAVEGIACYMESLRRDGDRLLLGAPDVPRLVAARYRALTDGFYIPLERFVTFSPQDFDLAGQDLPKYYSQSAGLCHFFMHYDQGRYRRAFMDYLATVYAGRAGSGTLAAALETDLATLDRQYFEFLREKVRDG